MLRWADLEVRGKAIYMKEKGPLDDFIESVNKILEIVQSKKKISTDKLSPDVEALLSRLEDYGDLLAKEQKGTLEKLGLQEEEVKRLVESKDHLPEVEKRPLEHLQKLKDQVESVQRELQVAEFVAKQREKNKGKPGKAAKARKKKFHRAGGRPDWKPL